MQKKLLLMMLVPILALSLIVTSCGDDDNSVEHGATLTGAQILMTDFQGLLVPEYTPGATRFWLEVNFDGPIMGLTNRHVIFEGRGIRGINDVERELIHTTPEWMRLYLGQFGFLPDATGAAHRLALDHVAIPGGALVGWLEFRVRMDNVEGVNIVSPTHAGVVIDGVQEWLGSRDVPWYGCRTCLLEDMTLWTGTDLWEVGLGMWRHIPGTLLPREYEFRPACGPLCGAPAMIFAVSDVTTPLSMSGVGAATGVIQIDLINYAVIDGALLANYDVSEWIRPALPNNVGAEIAAVTADGASTFNITFIGALDPALTPGDPFEWRLEAIVIPATYLRRAGAPLNHPVSVLLTPLGHPDRDDYNFILP